MCLHRFSGHIHVVGSAELYLVIHQGSFSDVAVFIGQMLEESSSGDADVSCVLVYQRRRENIVYNSGD